MNWLDFVILGVVAWFTLQAFLSGLVRETIGLVAVVGGVALAGLYHDELAMNLTIFTGDEMVLRVVAFLLIFGIVAILGWIAALFLRNTSEMLFLGWADRAGGAVFGFFKAVLIVQALTVIFVLQPTLGMEAVIDDSTIGAFFLDTTPIVRALLPSEFDQALFEFAA